MIRPHTANPRGSGTGAIALLVLTAMPGLAVADTKTETIEYHDNTTSWVLGQTERTTTDGAEVSRVVFVNDLPSQIFNFGQLQQTLTYDAQGNVQSISDGRDSSTFNTTITLTSWKRAIPQLITFPDGTSIAADVDDRGWVKWVRNEAEFTTHYEYDAMGRVNLIDYPDDDPTQPYLNTSITFAAAAAKYGIPNGHWRRTVVTGNSHQVTYYDALWRPLVSEAYDAADQANTLSQTVKRYDADGRAIFESYPFRGMPTSYTSVEQGIYRSFDALGRPIEVLQDSEFPVPLVTTISYENGKRQTTDPRGYVTTEAFQSFDAPSFEAPTTIDLPENTRTLIERDVFGKPLSITRGSSL